MNTRFNEIFNLGNWQQFFTAQFSSHDFIINIIDILVVWFLIYKLIMLVKGTKAVQLLKGIAVIIVIRVVSGLIGMNTVSYLMDQVITYGVLMVVIIFQPEVRRGLEHLGRGSVFRKTRSIADEENHMIQAFDKAIQYMSRRKIGALITIERETGLEEYIETGIALDADITGELLINIFIPNTPLHDGAVIIKDYKIAVACAYLPLSESNLIPKEFGTRHRAAVGISEVSDALTIVISEETGEVSLTLNNELLSHLSQEEYLSILARELGTTDKPEDLSLFQQFMKGLSKGAGKNVR